MNESAHDEILRVLGDYLDKKLRFSQVIIGWPQYNQKLKHPALSVVEKNSVFRPFPPQEIKRFKTSGPKADILWLVGEYEFSIQLDIWAKTKADRNDLYERMFVVLNDSAGEMPSSCFTLPMPKYHGIPATYFFEGFSLPDEERSTLEGEWRVLVRVKGVCDATLRKDNEPIILDPSVEIEVTESKIAEE